MAMAGRPWLVCLVPGLLICTLALHLSGQDPLAPAEHNAATSVAINTTSLAAATPASSVAATTTSSVATNTSVNSTEEPLLTCQSFQCSGERCYQEGAHASTTVTCHNKTHCELYRFSSTNYTAGCSSTCGREMCRTNGSVSAWLCTLDCCDSPLCLQLNASSYGDLPSTTLPLPPTTTPRAPPQNGKVCAGCFRGKKTAARCTVGQNFCEMKKMGWNYVARCSKACEAAKPVCADGVKAACYQECCPATPTGSCLRLDGNVHVSSTRRVTLAPLLNLVVLGVVLLLNGRVSACLWA